MSEVERLRAVVAAQREALRRIVHPRYGEPSAWEIARAALDAEGVSEPGKTEPTQDVLQRAPIVIGHESPTPGSLTSPVDTAPGAKP